MSAAAEARGGAAAGSGVTAEGSGGAADDAERPLDVRVVSGTPTDEELAAVIAVLQVAAATPRHGPAAQAPRVSGWDRARRDLRAPLPSVWSAWP